MSSARTALLLPLLFVLLLAGCAGRTAIGLPESVAKIDREYERLKAASTQYGPAALTALDAAHQALREGRLKQRYTLVELTDVWAHALHSGPDTFKSERPWAAEKPGAGRAPDAALLIGPWRIAVEDARTEFGPTYGVNKAWTNGEVAAFLETKPKIQAQIAIDIIQRNYDDLGQRGPYAIQQYFWLEGYLKNQTPLAAKELLTGTESNPAGLLYWLCIAGDETGARLALRSWRDQRRLKWDTALNRPAYEEPNAGLAITPADLRHLRGQVECYAMFHRLVGETLAERR